MIGLLPSMCSIISYGSLNLYGAHGVRGDVVDIVIEGDAVFAQVEVLRRREVAGGAVTHIFQCSMAGGYFLVRHQAGSTAGRSAASL